MQEFTSVVVLELFCKRTKFVLTKKWACLCPWELLLRIPLFLFVVFHTVIGEPETVVHCPVRQPEVDFYDYHCQNGQGLSQLCVISNGISATEQQWRIQWIDMYTLDQRILLSSPVPQNKTISSAENTPSTGIGESFKWRKIRLRLQHLHFCSASFELPLLMY